ncbi:hypothetical protein SAY87_029676 [Trapa incisa]|uniref:Uncharacterized protein n=1 Tax=Trapa incisa TaxID=236973 RepID=A0AAN7Q9A0_9MYRT|nr:hypothetical protein SAY87_029676 [Trapa incisa]
MSSFNQFSITECFPTPGKASATQRAYFETILIALRATHAIQQPTTHAMAAIALGTKQKSDPSTDLTWYLSPVRLDPLEKWPQPPLLVQLQHLFHPPMYLPFTNSLSGRAFLLFDCLPLKVCPSQSTQH